MTQQLNKNTNLDYVEQFKRDGYVVIENALPPAHNVAETPAQAAAMSINAGVDLECGSIYKNGGLYDAFKNAF